MHRDPVEQLAYDTEVSVGELGTYNKNETNRKLLRMLADIKESLLLEVIGVLEPFDTASLPPSVFLLTVSRHCTW